MTPPRGRAGRARSGGPTRGRSSFSPCLLSRWCRLVHAIEPALDLSHRLLGQDQETQDRAAVRLRNDCERRFHGLSILNRAYTCQGIHGATDQGVIAFLAPWGCGSRRAFSVTVTVLALIASAAHAGLSRIPSDGYSTPAASGMAIRL